MAIDPELVTHGGNTDNEPKPQPRKPFLQIRPGVALPLLASLLPCLRHRANTPPPVTQTFAATFPEPAPAVTPQTQPPPQTTQPASNNNVLMSVEDFARFIRSVKDLLHGTPLLWNGFLEVIKSFVPPPTPPSTSTCHAEG